MRKYLILGLVLLTGILLCGNTLAYQKEIRQFSKSLQSLDPLERVTALKMIAKYGSSDDSLFALINSLILKEADNEFAFDETAANRQTFRIGGASAHATYIDELAWMCDTLAYSGTSSYRATLKMVKATAPSFGKLKKYAELSFNKLTEYEKVSQCAAKNSSDISRESSKYICMIRAQPINIKKYGALHIYWSLALDDQVYIALENELLKLFTQIENENSGDAFSDAAVTIDKHLVDCLAWMCKALASSGQTEYQATLTAVTSKARKLGLYKLASYAQWSNDLISRLRETYAKMEAVKSNFGNLPPESNKSICLIKSNSLFLKSFGAQHIYWSERENMQVTDVIEQELLALNELYFPAGGNRTYRKKTTRDSINTMIWFCKVLGASGNEKYQVTLKKIHHSDGLHARLKHVLEKYID